MLLENTYRVHVFTGDVSNAGTNSNVFICAYGELGDTGERKLEKSETHMDKFERSNVRVVVFPVLFTVCFLYLMDKVCAIRAFTIVSRRRDSLQMQHSALRTLF